MYTKFTINVNFFSKLNKFTQNLLEKLPSIVNLHKIYLEVNFYSKFTQIYLEFNFYRNFSSKFTHFGCKFIINIIKKYYRLSLSRFWWIFNVEKVFIYLLVWKSVKYYIWVLFFFCKSLCKYICVCMSMCVCSCL